ncbi:MAG: hypothetical protein ACF8R7_07140, partial [Phycisphaerales bacterium JB039]
LDLARLLVAHQPSAERIEEALGLLDAIDPFATTSAPANELAGALHLRAIELARQRIEGADPASVQARGREVERAARRALTWAEARASPLTDRFRLELGEALLARGSGREAVAYLASISDRGAGLPGGPARVRLGLARARLLTADDAGAFQDLLELAESLDAPRGPGEPIRADAFWEAWALLLEILEGQNTMGERSGAIRAHVLRLRAIDPALGGEPWRRRIEDVEARLRR